MNFSDVAVDVDSGGLESYFSHFMVFERSDGGSYFVDVSVCDWWAILDCKVTVFQFCLCNCLVEFEFIFSHFFQKRSRDAVDARFCVREQ
jgi:hypothetical protein